MAYEEILAVSNDSRANFVLRRLCETAHISLTEMHSVPNALQTLRTLSPHLLLIHVELQRAEIRHLLQKKNAIFSLVGVPFVVMGFPESLRTITPGEFGSEAPSALLPLPLDEKMALSSLRKVLKERTIVSHPMPAEGELSASILGSVPATVDGATEGSMQLRSVIRFQEGVILNEYLQSKYVNEAALDLTLLRVEGTESIGDEFQAKVAQLGVSRQMAAKIRDLLGRRS
jgi:hypothetical protein